MEVPLMRRDRANYLLAFFLFNVATCFAHHMAVVVNKANDVENITSVHLARIVKSDTKKWPNGTDVVLVLHNSSKGEMLTLQKLNNMSEQELKARLEAHKDEIILVDSDADVLNTVEATPGAIGLVEVRSVNSQVKVVKVDGKLPLEAGYLPD
jgi:ABC-type phosphate transport system substrate-binding protein